MADKLNQLFKEWQATNPDGDLFQAFQGGLTAGAVSMRKRAMTALDDAVKQEHSSMPATFNAAKNMIGKLPDIPA